MAKTLGGLLPRVADKRAGRRALDEFIPGLSSLPTLEGKLAAVGRVGIVAAMEAMGVERLSP